MSNVKEVIIEDKVISGTERPKLVYKSEEEMRASALEKEKKDSAESA
jgi:hypothetical protein